MNEVDHLLINGVRVIKYVDTLTGFDSLSEYRMVRGVVFSFKKNIICPDRSGFPTDVSIYMPPGYTLLQL